MPQVCIFHAPDTTALNLEGLFLKTHWSLAVAVRISMLTSEMILSISDPFDLRPLTDCEKRKLAPFIPKIDLDNADVHLGKVPWYFHLVRQDFQGITRGNDIYFRPGVYDPTTVAGLATLGHELVHVGQYRNGLTWAEYVWASRHGDENNQYEKPAYDKQDEIENTMTKEKCDGCPKQPGDK